ncbi:T9SS type A sorting domain-containing protein [candidate division KSB1 bacterium]|nr:T9SS type A sorting domain-containing protein [candidate division KSB1 bacterium]
MFNKLICLLLVGLFASVLKAQVTGYTEDFNDNLLTGWEVPADQPYTFELSENDGVLKIAYHRVSQSWEWDNFNFIPPQPISAASMPYIAIKAKSDVSTELTFKPIYPNNESDWLSVNLLPDNAWHKYLVKLEKANLGPISRIFFYLDGGLIAIKSGTIYFDDLQVGDSVDIKATLNFIDLEIAVDKAQKLHDISVEGTEEGQFAMGSKATLQLAIQAAQNLQNAPNLTQLQIDAAVWELYDACVRFETQAEVRSIPVIDKLATKETKYLYDNLNFLSTNNLLFGMHDATGYGVGWTDDDDRSDVKDVCGDYPAVFSWDLASIALGNNWERYRYRMSAAYHRGGINTMCWHQKDPLNRSFYAKDINNEKIVITILPGGMYHEYYKDELKQIARFMHSLRGEHGESIPVIFRPYHEHDGGWFWWGVGHCTIEEYNALWQFTVHYLRDSLNVHNLLYAISPSSFNTVDDYYKIFPGDAYLDIYGMDFYFDPIINENGTKNFLNRLQIVAEQSRAHEKVAALTEVGHEGIPTPDWFTRVLLSPLKNDPLAKRVVYAAVWRNANTSHHFAPFPGHPSVPDFIKFYNDPYTLFEADLPNVYRLNDADSIPPVLTGFPVEPFTAVDTTVVIEIESDERAFLRYSPVDEPFDKMPFEFGQGQGVFQHATKIIGKQGESYVYYIRAKDFYGNETPNAIPLAFKIDTTQAPVYWYDVKYNDSAWKTGNAQFGFGNGTADKTQINSVNTAYFRHEFMLTNINTINYLAAIVKYDNGAVIYLNGKEIKRLNMPEGEINYETQAISATGGVKAINFGAAEFTLLREGRNFLAVEVHQAANDANDFVFDLRLVNPQPVIEYGSLWRYFDAGTSPENQTKGTGISSDYTCQLPKTNLFQNFPNPFNAETLIKFYIPEKMAVRVEIYNLLGQKIRTLINQNSNAGLYAIKWDGRNDLGETVGSGFYFYKLQTEQETLVRKLLLMK